MTEGNPQNKEDRQTPQALQKHQLCPHAGHTADTGSRLALEPLTGAWSSSGLKALAHLVHMLSPLPPPQSPGPNLKLAGHFGREAAALQRWAD